MSDTQSSSASTADQLQNKSIPSSENACGSPQADSTMSTIPPSTPPRQIPMASPYGSDGSPIQPLNSTPISGPEYFSGGSPWGLSYSYSPGPSSSQPTPWPLSPIQYSSPQASSSQPSPLPPSTFQYSSPRSSSSQPSPLPPSTFQYSSPQPSPSSQPQPSPIPNANATFQMPSSPPQPSPLPNATFQMPSSPPQPSPLPNATFQMPSSPPQPSPLPNATYQIPSSPPQGGGAWGNTIGIVPLGGGYTGEGSESCAFASKYIQQTYTLDGTQYPTFASAPLPATNFSRVGSPQQMNFSVPVPGQRLPPPPQPNQYNPPVAAGNSVNTTMSTIPPQTPPVPNYYPRDGAPQGPMNSTPISGAEYYSGSGNAWSPTMLQGPNRMNFTPRSGAPAGNNLTFDVNRSQPPSYANTNNGRGSFSSGPTQGGTRSHLYGDSMNNTMATSMRAEGQSFGSGISGYTDSCCCRCNKRGGFDNTQNMDMSGGSNFNPAFNATAFSGMSGRSEGWEDIMNTTEQSWRSNPQSQNGGNGSCCSRPPTPGTVILGDACALPGGAAAGPDPNARDLHINVSFPRNNVKLHLPNQPRPNNTF